MNDNLKKRIRSAGQLERRVRHDKILPKRCVPIDYVAIAKESGMSKGKIFYSKAFGWVVGNTSGNPDWPDMACITPPTLQPGEKLLQVKDNLWVFS